MSFIQFESSRVKEAERQALREAREKVLTDAEAAYRRKQAQAERAKERGDDKWMLPSVEAKLLTDSAAKKKKKKEKKAKKSKKKKKKHRGSSFDSDSSNEEQTEWVQKEVGVSMDSSSKKLEKLVPEKPLERDEWMTLPGSFFCSSRDEKQKKDSDKQNETTCILDKPGQSARELNPYWKDGGTGLPKTELDVQGSRGKAMDPRWLKKSLQRAHEQAEEEGRSIDEIAAERWGSLDTIHSMIEEAEKNSRRNDEKPSSRGRRMFDTDGSQNRYTEDRDREQRSRYRYRTRSRSRERDRKHGPNHDDGKFCDARKKMFMQPNDDEYTSTSSSRKYSSNVKRWRKTDANDKPAESRRDSTNLPDKKTAVRESSEESSSDHSRSENNEKKIPEMDDDKADEVDTIMTEAEMNRLGAKIVKAEIMGDTDLAAKLKAKLELARETRKNKPEGARASRPAEEEDVVLTRINAKGMARPLEPRSLYEEPSGGRRRGKKVDTHESGKRVRYFADDDKFTLQEMFQKERGQTSADDDATFVKMASKSMDMDELFEQRITREETDAKQDARDRARAIKDHKKLEKSLDNCHSCFDSKNMLKHLIVAMGSKIYVSLPAHVSMTVGHCILAPIHHVSCQTQLDEDVWEELQNFKKALTKMFTDRKEFPVFFELSVGQRRFPHMRLECIPLPDEVGSMAPIYFKKALLECEMEWSTNKKVIDLSTKDVRQAIPKGLPYFAVNFANHGGFAHVIEDENLFPRNFAQEILGGILDLDHSLWRKPRRENFDQQRKKVLEFAASWKNYDFTTDQ